MTARDVLKRLPAIAMLVCDFIMGFVLLAERREASEQLHWSVRVLLPMGAAALLVLAFLLFILKEKKTLFRLASLAMVFCCNVFSSKGIAAQTCLIVIFVFELITENISVSRFSNFAIVAVSFFVSLSMALFTVPYLQRIKTPKAVTDIEIAWFSLIEEIKNAKPQPTIDPDADSELDTESGELTGNVITNDPFDPLDPKLSLVVKPSCDLDKLMIFSCTDYYPGESKFLLVGPSVVVENSSSSYYYSALSPAPENELPGRVEILDDSIYSDLRVFPFCDFRCAGDTRPFRDCYFYRGEGERPQSYVYYVDTANFYVSKSPGYSDYALYRYTGVPGEFREILMDFMDEYGIEHNPKNRYQTVREIYRLLEDAYTYTNEPPKLPEGEDPVLWFLLESKEGYSKHFAAAQVLLYRTAGIPARYCYGYAFEAPAGEETEVTEGNAYAFCQVYLDGRWMLAGEVREAEKSDEVPEGEQPEPEGETQPQDPEAAKRTALIRNILIAAVAVFALVMAFALLYSRFGPDAEQKINIAYRTVCRFYFVRDEVKKCMIKVRYSKDGASDEDVALMEGEVKRTKDLYVYKKNLIMLLAVNIFLACQKTAVMFGNMFAKKEGETAA